MRRYVLAAILLTRFLSEVVVPTSVGIVVPVQEFAG
jgi:hypothetical protein